MLNVVESISLFGRCRVWVEIFFRILLEGCAHLLPGKQCLGTSTKLYRCCVHTLRTRYITVHIVTPFRPVTRNFEQQVQNSGLPQKKPKRCAHGDQVPYFCPSTRSRPCTQAPSPFPNSSVSTWKKDVFTLVPSKYRTRGHRAQTPTVDAV